MSSSDPFIWYELMTTDSSAAGDFYKSVLGWSTDPQPGGPPDNPYVIVSMAEKPLGGMFTLTAEHKAAGAHPAWVGYIAVDDVDDMAAKVTSAGGAVHRAPSDLPGVGRFAMVADPHGAGFVLFKGEGEMPPTVANDALGHVGWRELHAGDREEDFAFYAGLFGWTKADAVDMGPMGLYQLFAAGDAAIGGMMTKMAEVPAPHWLFYFTVESVDAAVERIKTAGGQVINGPHQVPGGAWIAQCFDPQGAMFAISGVK